MRTRGPLLRTIAFLIGVTLVGSMVWRLLELWEATGG